MSQMILALYDCRSKQEYIYRTNRIKEISGGSLLLANIYDLFLKETEKNGIRLFEGGSWENRTFNMELFSASDSDAEVVYSGGGNLMMLYRDKDTYVRANKIFSKLLLSETYSVSAIVACTEVTGDFMADRAKLFRQNAIKKSTGYISSPRAVLPFTQVDSLTYMPVVKKDNTSLSRESECKLDALKKYERKDKELSEIYLDDIVTEKGVESLLAVIYIDGNNMGEKSKLATEGKTSYDDCINAMRNFSVKTNRDFVDKPIAAIEDLLRNMQKDGVKYAKYRKVIAGGDEITLICNARIVPDILNTYFATLDSERSGNYACAGVALFHSHAPFADVYDIAEQCCESGKKASRHYGSKANFIDYHFCRSGISNDMETVRAKQEKGLYLRPYRVGKEHNGTSYEEWTRFAIKISAIGRSNIKELAAAIIKGDSYYRFEAERINSRYKDILIKTDLNDERYDLEKKLLFDVAQVYDLWFSKEVTK